MASACGTCQCTISVLLILGHPTSCDNHQNDSVVDHVQSYEISKVVPYHPQLVQTSLKVLSKARSIILRQTGHFFCKLFEGLANSFSRVSETPNHAKTKTKFEIS